MPSQCLIINLFLFCKWGILYRNCVAVHITWSNGVTWTIPYSLHIVCIYCGVYDVDCQDKKFPDCQGNTI